MRVWRWVLGVYAIAAIVGYGWIFSLPNVDQCAARGDVPDPTGRHCGAAADTSNWVQLEEHALMHSTEAVLGVAVLTGIGYGLYRLGRRLRRSP